MHANAYDSDLAYIHDRGFSGFAEGSAAGVLKILGSAIGNGGSVVDLGCGSAIWAAEVAKAGYRVVGVDISAAMVEIARTRVPEGEFVVDSCFTMVMPACQAVTALGEVFNYLFDGQHSLRAMRGMCKRIYDALAPGGVLVFDVAEPGRCQDRPPGFWMGDDWACLVAFEYDGRRDRLTRKITTFRQLGEHYRRQEETHVQQLYRGTDLAEMLRKIGFRVRLVRKYGEYALPKHVVGVVARKE